jgi:ABC-type taurine transport system ATPase subunit
MIERPLNSIEQPPPAVEVVFSVEGVPIGNGDAPLTLDIRSGEIVPLSLDAARRSELLRQLLSGYLPRGRAVLKQADGESLAFDGGRRPGPALGVWTSTPPLLGAAPDELLRLAARTAGIRDRARRAELLERLGLDDFDQPLAGADQRRLVRCGLALALIGAPRLLIADDPLIGLDPAAAVGLMKLLPQLLDGAGVLYLGSPPGRPGTGN